MKAYVTSETHLCLLLSHYLLFWCHLSSFWRFWTSVPCLSLFLNIQYLMMLIYTSLIEIHLCIVYCIRDEKEKSKKMKMKKTQNPLKLHHTSLLPFNSNRLQWVMDTVLCIFISALCCSGHGCLVLWCCRESWFSAHLVSSLNLKLEI